MEETGKQNLMIAGVRALKAGQGRPRAQRSAVPLWVETVPQVGSVVYIFLCLAGLVALYAITARHGRLPAKYQLSHCLKQLAINSVK